MIVFVVVINRGSLSSQNEEDNDMRLFYIFDIRLFFELKILTQLKRNGCHNKWNELGNLLMNVLFAQLVH